MTRVLFALVATVLALALQACAPEKIAGCDHPVVGADTVYIAAHGWHVEVGLLADRLQGPLAVYREIFPGARAVMFGYGKRTFMTAKADTFSEYIIGPLPGPAVIQATGLSILPTDAYLEGETIVLALPPGGAAALSNFIWSDLAKDKVGGPRLVGLGNYPGSLFYDARSEYNLLHTCNTWAVDALAAAGLRISGSSVIFAGQATRRAMQVLAAQCRTGRPA